MGRPMPSVVDAAAAIREGRLSALGLVEECLERIAAGNDELNAFVFLDPDGARRAAEDVDRQVARGEGDRLGPLAGVPFGVKDLEDCAGMPTSHGSLLYKGLDPVPADSEHVSRLRARRGHPAGQDRRARVRHAALHLHQGLGRHPQPVEPRADPGWLERWDRGGGGGRT